MNNKLQRLVIGPAFFCCFLAFPVHANMPSSHDRWEYGGSAYLWLAGVDGTTTADDSINVSFNDVVDTLDLGLMGLLTAQKGKWMLFGDFIYLSLSEDINTTANIVGNPAELDADFELKGFVSTFGVTYRVFEDDRTSLDIVTGARYFYLDVDLDGNLAASPISYSDSEDTLDGIIGTQVKIDLTESWYFSLYADVGAGDSKLTWQAWPLVGYKFAKLDAVAGYRYLKWETDNGNTFDDLSFNGPMFGAKFLF